jgi:glucokinase
VYVIETKREERMQEQRHMAGDLAIGVDFGGTKLLAAVVDVSTGDVLGTAKKKTNPDDDAKALMHRIYDGVDGAMESAGLKKKQEIAGIGVGIAGQIDSEAGILLGAPNLSQATVNLPIASMLEERFEVPAALLNDVQVAALGEGKFGAGKDCSDFFCVFVGTGVGGAIVHDGALYTGATGTAGEVGHLIIHANGRHCGCGGRGHLEAYASRTAITRTILGELKRGRTTVLTKLEPSLEGGDGDGSALRSGLLAKAMKEHDPLVTETLTEAGTDLGLGLASVINLLNPSRIIVGGGVIEAVDYFFEVASQRALRESLPTAAKSTEIVRAALGDNAGIVGAAILGASRATQQTAR